MGPVKCDLMVTIALSNIKVGGLIPISHPHTLGVPRVYMKQRLCYKVKAVIPLL